MNVRSAVATMTVLLVAILWSGSGTARAAEVDLQALTQETQRMSRKPEAMTMVWWVPEEFWAASFAQAPGMSKAQADDFLRTLRPYTMLVVVDGTMGSFGGVTYKSEDFVRANTRLLDAQGRSYAPRTSEEIDADTRNILMMMKPVFVNMLGPTGQNMHFLLFPGQTQDGQPMARASGKGEFTARLGDASFTWQLPLDSVLPPKSCAECSRACKGSWDFCPWCGTRLAGGSRAQAEVKP